MLLARALSKGSTTIPKNALLRNFSSLEMHGTTIICVRKGNKVCMKGDGMVSMGNMIVKPNAKKIRTIEPKNCPPGKKTVVGFAGTTADAFTLLERLEGRLEEYPGQLQRSCVELAKGWRTDKYLRKLEAALLVADDSACYEITGNGDVLESHDGVLGVGSGSPYAIAAARALMDTDYDAEQIATKAMQVASEMCVYTNDNFMTEVLEAKDEEKESI